MNWKLNGKAIELKDLISYAEDLTKDPKMKSKFTKPIISDRNFNKDLDRSLTEFENISCTEMGPRVKKFESESKLLLEEGENENEVVVNVASVANDSLNDSIKDTYILDENIEGLPFITGNLLSANEIAHNQSVCPFMVQF